MSLGDRFFIRESAGTGSDFCFFFNPTIIKGKLINFLPSEVLLESNDFVIASNNNTAFTSDDIVPQSMLDRKESVAYNVTFVQGNNPEQTRDLRALFITNPLQNSYVTDKILFANNGDIRFFIIDTSTLFIEKIVCDPKYKPVKVGFINKFGVIQDLVFFKKRVDTFSTSQQDFKANILRNGTYLPHTGQKQIINKQASAKLKLSTGFYPEEFNEVFKQLQYSINYWIDDEPAILTGSNFAFKTSVNDKLINYSFDFEYANPDINDIR
jgi:hypothetical protein